LIIVASSVAGFVISFISSPKVFDLTSREFSYEGLGYSEVGGGPELRVRQGETVRINIRNIGAIDHSIFIVNQDELDRILAAIRSGLDEKNIDLPSEAFAGAKIVVKPGESGSMTFTPSRSGTFAYACLEREPRLHVGFNMFAQLVVTP
jgi:uncharacterized cupredoxin-like copper-binding protein